VPYFLCSSLENSSGLQQLDPIAIIYKAIGADAPFYKLVDEFYAGVEHDPVLRPLYPQDLTESKQHLAMFLIQRAGGATTYSDQRGHPRMRQRHMPFKIGVPERDAWLHNMFAAVDKVPEFAPHRDALREYFTSFATFLMNQ
jgi:hemoglobin